MSLTPTSDETWGIIMGVASHLLDQTCGIMFPVVFSNGAYSGVSLHGIGGRCWHYKHTKIPHGQVGINCRQLNQATKGEIKQMGNRQMKGRPVKPFKIVMLTHVTFSAITGPESQIIWASLTKTMMQYFFQLHSHFKIKPVLTRDGGSDQNVTCIRS